MKEKAEVGGPYSKRYQVLKRMEPFYVVIADIVILPRHTLAYAAVVNMWNNLWHFCTVTIEKYINKQITIIIFLHCQSCKLDCISQHSGTIHKEINKTNKSIHKNSVHFV